MKRYNHPCTVEPAVIFVSPDGSPPSNRDIAVWPHGYPTHRVSELNEHVDPLSYPLLFPNGDLGWHARLEHKTEHQSATYTRLTPAQFYGHRLMIRDLDNPLPHGAGLLWQQYVCDAYSRTEGQRLNFLRMHQKDLRAEIYQGLYDAVHDPEKKFDGKDIGKRVILPSSYQGSPRAMHQNYLDAMAIVRKYGKPDYFITMTASPGWSEIRENLRTGETAAGRPDLVARVFRQKFRTLLDELLHKHVLGVVIAYTWVIEFQKRGLPHAHLLVIVRAQDRPRTPADIDRRIVAELPDPANPEQRGLLATLLSSHIHGPCGQRNQLAPCMSGKVCEKGFPKEFAEVTVIQDNGYPKYRRRETSPSCVKGEHPVDARDVVPYNPYLSRLLQCHLNVEFCGTVRAVKYLYKYTYKGHDRATVKIGEDSAKAKTGKDKEQEHVPQNEVTQYLDTRYVGPPEACWRLLEYPMHAKSHVIVRLAVHEFNKHSAVFLAGEAAKAVEDAAVAMTTLSAWFALNNADESARKLTYAEIPEHYVYHKKDGVWKGRDPRAAKARVIGRLHSASPSEGERFYLYLLLLHVPGGQGYEHMSTYLISMLCVSIFLAVSLAFFARSLWKAPGFGIGSPRIVKPPKSYRKTVDGKEYGTYRAAAEARGLVDDDSEYFAAMTEAAVVKNSGQLRLLLAHTLLHCGVSKPEVRNLLECQRFRPDRCTVPACRA